MTSAAREAIVLPIAFLTVLLLGSVRVAETTVLAPPSVYTLVLGLLFMRIVAGAEGGAAWSRAAPAPIRVAYRASLA